MYHLWVRHFKYSILGYTLHAYLTEEETET